MRLRNKVLSGVLLIVLVLLGGFAFMIQHDSPCSTGLPVPPGTASMRAVTYRCYGPPEVLKLEQIAKPAPADDEVLVRVQAASLNPLDWHYMRGTPYLVRLDAGIGAPHNPRLGVDFAGTVEAVGKNVTHFKPGDQVFGGKFGALADYVSVREERAIAVKPPGVTLAQAAAVAVAGTTALQALREKGQLRSGQSVLINGASGGVGTFAVQIAKALGAQVTGVCSTRNVAMVRSLGADHVIDYTREDFMRGTQRYDLIIDNVGNHSLSELRRVLNPHGALVIVGGATGGNWIDGLSRPLGALLLRPFFSQRFLPLLAELNQKDLVWLGDLMRAGKLTPVLDQQFSLAQAPAAMRYLEAGHARGKVSIIVD